MQLVRSFSSYKYSGEIPVCKCHSKHARRVMTNYGKYLITGTI